MAFWCEAKESSDVDRFSEPLFIVQCRDICQGYDGSDTWDGHQSACQVTLARHDPYFIVQRVSGNAERLVQRDEHFCHQLNRRTLIRDSSKLIPKILS